MLTFAAWSVTFEVYFVNESIMSTQPFFQTGWSLQSGVVDIRGNGRAYVAMKATQNAFS